MTLEEVLQCLKASCESECLAIYQCATDALSGLPDDESPEKTLLSIADAFKSAAEFIEENLNPGGTT